MTFRVLTFFMVFRVFMVLGVLRLLRVLRSSGSHDTNQTRHPPAPTILFIYTTFINNWIFPGLMLIPLITCTSTCIIAMICSYQ